MSIYEQLDIGDYFVFQESDTIPKVVYKGSLYFTLYESKNYSKLISSLEYNLIIDTKYFYNSRTTKAQYIVDNYNRCFNYNGYLCLVGIGTFTNYYANNIQLEEKISYINYITKNTKIRLLNLKERAKLILT